jgi:exodeoxyribonuclease V gamma subunit
MLQLFYSHRTEALMERLAANLARQREERGIWEPVHLVVPNAQVETYVRQGLAQSLRIAAHLKVRFLDGLYRFSLPEQDPPLRLLDRAAYQGALLALFQTPGFLDQAALAPVRNYLRNELGGTRAVQLSHEVARLFEEYTLSRPEWLAAWGRDQEPGTRAPLELEAWQRLLWRACRTHLEAAPFRWISLPEYLDSEWVEQTAFPPAIHLFGLSHVSQTYHQVFRRLAQRTELLLYTLNPCEAFWDDLESERRLPVEALFAREDEAEAPLESRALQLWGRPGREHIRLLNAEAGYDFESDFPELRGDTLLQSLLEEIRHRGQAAIEPRMADESLRILACPSARREAEAVADRIWEAVEDFRTRGEALRFSEIAIIVPAAQREACAAHLRAAFEAAHGIPLTELDGPGAGMASLVEAAQLLLRLPLSGLDRRSVLEALGHPALRELHPDLDPGPWAEWCGAVGIVRGADAAELAGSYVEHDLLNWDQGLKRLALGAFLPPETGLELEGERFWPGPEAEGSAAFLALARSLVSDLQRLRGLRLDPRQWVLQLSEFLERHLGSQDEGRSRNLQRLLKGLAKLVDLAPEGLQAAQLEYAGALELARGTLDRTLSEGSAALARGVVLASYLPMRAIPFKVLFLMGLGEGLFPVRDPVNPLDLRTFRRRLGDVSPGERDRYLFLEMLLCARERLVLSYVARDPITGESLEPSPLLRELGEIAEVHLLESARAELRMEIPLWRHADASSRAPGARLEAQAAWLARNGSEGILDPKAAALLPALEMPPAPRRRARRSRRASPSDCPSSGSGWSAPCRAPPPSGWGCARPRRMRLPSWKRSPSNPGDWSAGPSCAGPSGRPSAAAGRRRPATTSCGSAPRPGACCPWGCWGTSSAPDTWSACGPGRSIWGPKGSRCTASGRCPKASCPPRRCIPP